MILSEYAIKYINIKNRKHQMHWRRQYNFLWTERFFKSTSKDNYQMFY